MRYRVIVRPAAETDLRQIADWYDDQQAGLGNEFLLVASSVFAELEESAHRYPPYYRDFRRLLLDRFPYKVFYRLTDDDVFVFRVLHVARDHRQELE